MLGLEVTSCCEEMVLEQCRDDLSSTTVMRWAALVFSWTFQGAGVNGVLGIQVNKSKKEGSMVSDMVLSRDLN